jgi:hypothetical protein
MPGKAGGVSHLRLEKRPHSLPTRLVHAGGRRFTRPVKTTAMVTECAVGLAEDFIVGSASAETNNAASLVRSMLEVGLRRYRLA